ncbi:hypothetical protein EDC14_102347 [Hydrogenispora ethanolica]|uniref:Tetratricopeptide repeat protein n=1 Tax=Hydrogenispora ethanolica TaxID=1082276 RepID=A0A4R1RAM6_HYDET|nr:hypothetical protein [Hydrogenispora ethanolica]TCL62768.1 hypothetical protein EDC14_102347 [Hydrogenispora ethanolica]
MRKLTTIGPLALMAIFLLTPLATAAPDTAAPPEAAALVERLTAAPWDGAARLELARTYYQSAGLARYFSMRTLLWTESAKRRGDLQPLLPKVEAERSRSLREQLQRLFTIRPDDPAGLLLAGDYHSFYSQKQTALWYYQRALANAPDSLEARLALADYYLFEWQPERALAALADRQEPLAALRRGAAFWQKGQYHMALGYLVQAHPLPLEYQATREKMLAQAYLAVGDPAAAAAVSRGTSGDELLPRVLFQELKGWVGWLAGAPDAARQAWADGKALFPDYRFWDPYLNWLAYHQGTGSAPGSGGQHWRDSDLRSLAKLWAGYEDARKDDAARARQNFLAAVQLDHRALLGFLEAGNQQFKKGNDSAALDLFVQGLAVNSNFAPLLRQRAEVYRKLKEPAKAEKDQKAATKALASAKSALLNGTLTVNHEGKGLLILSGATKDLLGFWFSPDGSHWQWEFWWGGPLVLKNNPDALWVLPAGNGLSGEALYLQKTKAAAPAVTPGPPEISPTAVRLSFSEPVRLIVENLSSGGAWVGEEAAQAFAIPLAFFQPGHQDLRLWYQGASGIWRRAYLTLQAPESPPQLPVSIALEAQPFTADRRIRCRVMLQTPPTAGLEMSLSEAGAADPAWLPYRPQAEIVLSDGDGPKTIVLRVRDRSGTVVETSTVVEADTQPPRVAQFTFETGEPERLALSWQTDEPVTAELHLFHPHGDWQELAVGPWQENDYRVELDPTAVVYCRLLLKDRAGNRVLYTPAGLNERLSRNLPVRFEIEDGPAGFIKIRPTDGEPEFAWSVSNDLRIWSAWRQGDEPLVWRPVVQPGVQFVYIRYRFNGEDTRLMVQPVPGAKN